MFTSIRAIVIAATLVTSVNAYAACTLKGGQT